MQDFSINDRYMAVLEYYNYSGYRFSQDYEDVSESKVSNIKKHKNRPSEIMLNNLFSKFPDVNKSWLLLGEGEMINSIKPEQKNEVKPIPYDNYMVVEFADLSTSAGKLGVENPAVLPDMKKRLIPKEFENGNYLVVGVDGDSMDNGTSISIPDGSEILIKEYDFNKGERMPIRNNLFVIVSNSGTVFKQIIEHNLEGEFIICHSYNPNYKDFKIHFSEIIQIFIYRKIVSFRPTIPQIEN